MNLAFILVAEIPEKLWNFSLMPAFLKAAMYFLAMLPPPQTIMNLYFLEFLKITFLNFCRKLRSISPGIIKLPPRFKTITFFFIQGKKKQRFLYLTLM